MSIFDYFVKNKIGHVRDARANDSLGQNGDAGVDLGSKKNDDKVQKRIKERISIMKDDLNTMPERVIAGGLLNCLAPLVDKGVFSKNEGCRICVGYDARHLLNDNYTFYIEVRREATADSFELDFRANHYESYNFGHRTIMRGARQEILEGVRDKKLVEELSDRIAENIVCMKSHYQWIIDPID